MSGLEWSLLMLGLLGSALYSGLETGVVSVNRLRIQHLIREKTPGAQRIHRYLQDPDRLLGTTLAGTNLCNILISVIGAQIAVQLLNSGQGLWVASVFTTFILLIFGEYLPKAWFRSYPAYRVLPFARFLDISALFFYPVSAGIMRFARWVIPSPDAEGSQRTPFITREELQYLAREGEKAGELSSSERVMMQGVLALTYKTCAEIMTPRSQMILCRAHTPASRVLELARRHNISRFPIYDDRTHKFTGFINTIDLLLMDELDGRQAQDFSRPPQYVEASAQLNHIIPRLRLTRQPLALVQNSQQVVIGLISIEDVMEEIVGEM